MSAMRNDEPRAPILLAKAYGDPSVFRPEALMREARRQKGLGQVPVPALCVLDPDGDILRGLQRDGRARPRADWACYHTELFEFDQGGGTVGIVGRAVGAAFAVLVAEELFASGCRMLVSITSAGQIDAGGNPPYFVVIDRALRDEGVSYHYLPPAEFALADPALVALALARLRQDGVAIRQGATWTTDAPFRETEIAIGAARERGILAVEMEAAGLYAFAQARKKAVLCIAHITNLMGQIEGDFEKGEDGGAVDALRVIEALARG